MEEKAAPNVTLDQLDRKIINELQADGRRPYTEIAKRLGVSEATVRKRVTRLQNRGALQIVAAVDPLALGYIRTEVSIRVRGPSVAKVADKIGKIPEVSYMEKTLGEYDLSISLTCRDTKHLTSVLNDEIRAIPGVEAIYATLVLEVLKDVYDWSPDD